MSDSKLVRIKYNDGTDVEINIIPKETPSREQINEWMAIYEMAYMLAREKESRVPNFPEYITEALACIHYNATRFVPANSSDGKGGDLYNWTTQTINEVKGGMGSGPASFSPKIYADRILYVRVVPLTWTYSIYNLDYADIKIFKINKTQTFEDQQKEGKRPRFDLLKYVNDRSIVGEYSGNIYTNEPNLEKILRNIPKYKTMDSKKLQEIILEQIACNQAPNVII